MRDGEIPSDCGNRVDAETKQKIAAEMQRLGIKSESEYIRRLVDGEFPMLKQTKRK